MKKKLLIILGALIIFNGIIAGFLVYDIQVFQPPQTSVFIEVLGVNSEEILLNAKINITNPNPFQLSVTNFQVLTMTLSDIEIGNIIIPGGTINSTSTQTFTAEERFKFNGLDFNLLKNTVSSTIGINILGIIQKTIPFEIVVITSIQELLNTLKPPEITVTATFDEITEEGLSFSAELDVFNPNTFEFSIEDLVLNITTEKDIDVGNLIIHGNTVEPKETQTFLATGVVDFDVLDAEMLFFKIQGRAGARVGGIEKSIPFTMAASFEIPSISDFILLNNDIEFAIPLQFRCTINGILGTIGFNIYNPSNITLVGSNLICKLYRLDAGQETLLAEKEMESCEIEARNRICIRTELLISYRDFFNFRFGHLLADWIILRIEGDFSLLGTRQVIPIALNAFVDPHIFRNSEPVEFYPS